VAFFVFILFSQSFASASFIIAFPAGDFSVLDILKRLLHPHSSPEQFKTSF
jgi:hypothetical protein